MYGNGKMRALETILRMGGGWDKGEQWRGRIQPWYTVRTFVNVTMLPPHTIIKKKIIKTDNS
jgi:hypothetical protein